MIVVDPANPKGIVWLASYPKSGNTWIRVFMYAQQQVLGGNRPEKIDINNLGLFAISDHDPGHFQTYLGRPISTLTLEQIAEIRPQVQNYLMQQSNGVILVKTHSAQMMIDGYPAINRQASAGAIYVIRNPLDIAISLARYRSISVDQAIADMATSMLAHVALGGLVPFVTGSWSEHVESWTNQSDEAVLVVRYEDMIDKPSETFGKLASHVLMQPNDDQLSAAIELCSFSRLQAAEKDTGFVGKGGSSAPFFREGRSEQWRDGLTPAQIDRVVKAHGAQMARFGYLP
jgi:Sulfotransferase domain